MITTASNNRTWTVLSLIQWGTEYLQSKGMESPRLTIELLLAHLLRCRRIELYTNFDKPLLAEDLSGFKTILNRRLANEPVQYIIGTADFMGHELNVDRRVLIPRPETELLVEEVVIGAKQSHPRSILEIGTGSGNIAIALARALPDIVVDTVDISTEALSLASKNIAAHNLGSRVRLYEGNVLAPTWKAPASTYDVIVSNPPYISDAEFDLLEPGVRLFEPEIALTDRGDGLSFYRRIAEIGDVVLSPTGMIFLEIAYNQLERVSGIFEKKGFHKIVHRCDYSAIPRVVMFSRK